MKKIIFITLLTALVLSSCKDDTAGVSHIVSYPVIKLKGDAASTILVNGNYTDAGFTATKGTTDLSSSVKVTGTVDATKAGVYTITYSVTDADGYSASARRYVGVITPAAAALDISGTYGRNAGAFGLAIVKKTSYPGLYTNNNPGGATVDGTSTAAGGVSVTNIIVYMFQTDATVVTVPSQNSTVGEFACTGGVYDATGTSPLYKWVCINSGYGTAVRTFIKQ
jgi:hypothetical protein